MNKTNVGMNKAKDSKNMAHECAKKKKSHWRESQSVWLWTIHDFKDVLIEGSGADFIDFTARRPCILKIYVLVYR